MKSEGEVISMPPEQKDAWVVTLEALRTDNFPVAVKGFLYLSSGGSEMLHVETKPDPDSFVAPFTYSMAALSATLTVKESQAHTRGYLEGLAARTEEKFFELLASERSAYMTLLQLATEEIPDELNGNGKRKVKKLAIDNATYQALALLATVANENSLTAADMLDIADNYLSTQVLNDNS